MFARRRAYILLLAVLMMTGLVSAEVAAQRQMSRTGNAVLWRDPGDISSLDLRYGPGSPELAPLEPFVFVEEEKQGESPKFRVRDARGTHWTVKLGPEAQAETVSTRLVWAMGYFAEEAYHLPEAAIIGLPRLSRGRQHVSGNIVRGARFEPKREGVAKGPNWKWLSNPFVGTRELNGLKVLMALLANYDTSTVNNRVLIVTHPTSGRQEHRYTVTDLGATLGRVGGLGGNRSKNDLKDFRSARFIRSVGRGMVEFDYHTKPTKLGYLTFVFAPRYWGSQADKERAIRRVPVSHARWIGQRLSRLTDDQLRDAFAAANYSNHVADGYIQALRQRFYQLRTARSVAKIRRTRRAR